jgi:hypothetical protein
VKDIYLTMRKVKVSPGILLGHADALMKTTAKFPITRKECRVYSIPAQLHDFVKDNIFLGQLPKRVIIGMVSSEAFAGNTRLNPYKFDHFNVRSIQLYADGEPISLKPVEIDVDNKRYLEAFETLSKSFDKFDGEKSSIIKRRDWLYGYSLFSFDLTPDFDGDDHYPLIRHGNLRLDMKFDIGLVKPINVIVYAEFDNIIEISNNRNIQFDYTS